MTHLKKPGSSPELRQRVLTCIDKLSDRATLQQALNELELITRTLPSDSLPNFLSCIISIDSSTKSSVRVHCINLLSLLIETHLDFLSPHVTKTILPFLLRRLRDSDSAVRSACATTAAAMTSSPAAFSSLLGVFTGAVMSEQDVSAQIGCCVCLKAAVDSASVVGGDEVAELRRVVPKMVRMVRGEGFKAKAAILGLIASVVGVNDGGFVKGKGGLVGNVVGCAVEMLSNDDWATRKAAAEVLEAVAIAASEADSVMEVKRFVVGSLESRRFDKVKITRETMNRALDAWKDVPGGPEEDLILSRSNSKENGSCGSSLLVSRRYSFAGMETPKPKKTITKTRSSLSDGPVSSISSSSEDIVGLETPQRKKSLTKSRSFMSDDSTVTDSSSLSKSSHESRLEIPQPKKPTTKSRSTLLDELAANVMKKRTVSNGNDSEVVAEDGIQSQCEVVEGTGLETKSNLKKTSGDTGLKVRGLRSNSRVVPIVGEAESQRRVVEGGTDEEVGENNADVEELSLIRNQLLQIERQQSNLMDMLQRFMGNSQNGIDSLETRVSGLERALDEISYDLAVQSGRIPSSDTQASTCCPSTEFLSPKFWRRTETRSSISKSGVVPCKESNVEGMQKEGIFRDEMGSFEVNSSKTVKSMGQNAQRGRMCSPRSFDGASNTPFIAPVIRGA